MSSKGFSRPGTGTATPWSMGRITVLPSRKKVSRFSCRFINWVAKGGTFMERGGGGVQPGNAIPWLSAFHTNELRTPDRSKSFAASSKRSALVRETGSSRRVHLFESQPVEEDVVAEGEKRRAQ